MKILLISPTQSGIGGIAQHVQGLKNFLKNEGNNVEIISSENTFTIPIKGLKNPSFMISSSLKAKFKKNNDIVHAHNIPSAKAMKNASGKKILTIHGIYSQQIENLHWQILLVLIILTVWFCPSICQGQSEQQSVPFYWQYYYISLLILSTASEFIETTVLLWSNISIFTNKS